jgi:NAD(P)H-dependent FMN reductase
MTTIISASTRPSDSTHRIAFLFQDLLTKMNIKSQIVTPSDYDFPFDGAKDPKWTETINNTDHLILVTSEYNHSFPGKLKTLLDAEFDAYDNKKIIVCGISSGVFGGARGVISLLPVLHKLGFNIFSTDIFTPMVKEILEDETKKSEWLERTETILTKYYN